jgi:hypothetical protein
MPRLLRPNGVNVNTVACWVKRASMGEARPDPRRKSRRDLIFEIQMNLDFGKTLKFSTRRFRMNLEGFFLNSSRLLKDF